jgi:hypothetical protein
LLHHDLGVEIALGERLPFLDLTGKDIIGPTVDISVRGAGHLAHLERGQEAVIDPVAKGVNVHGRARIGIGIGIVPGVPHRMVQINY